MEMNTSTTIKFLSRKDLSGIFESCLMLLTVILMLKFLDKIVLLLSLVFLAAISRIYLRFLPLPIGFDLVLFATYVVYLRFGCLYAIIIGWLSLFLNLVVSGDNAEKRLPSFLGLATSIIVLRLMGYSGLGGVAGVLFSILFNLFAMPLYYFLGARFHNIFIFATTNVLFNYLVFSALLPVFLSL